ncbi:MAG TPA: GAF domain-containing protein, partial [Solirubrobacteraceae bacterium]|nr:GAF domain-containing protein [Solirubrobacteraceae bacterium]
MLALAPGLSVAALLAVVDFALQPSTVLVGFVVLAPLLTALFGTPRDVVVVGAISVLIVVVSGAGRDELLEDAYVYRVFIVTAVSVLAVLAALGRVQVHRDRERFALLAALAEITDGTRSLSDTIAGLNDLVVPAVADICIVDAVSGGSLQRLGVRVAGPRAEQETAAIAARPPATADELGNPEQPRLLALDDAVLRQIATDAQDLERLRALGARSAIVVPLRARGRRLGTLTLITTANSDRRYGEHDLDFAKVLAGRAALALDNAGLFSELETIEAQLTAALSTLAEAVTVQLAEGSLIYANEAAARMLGFDSPRELLATPLEQVVTAVETTREDGSP